MSAYPDDILAVEAKYPNHSTQVVEKVCPFCGAEIDKNYGNIYFCGTEIESQLRTTTCWSRENRALRNQLTKAEQIVNIIYDDTIYIPTPLNRVMMWYGLINDYRNKYYPNPADDPNNCLACMGATGSAVRHTCK